VSSRGMGEAEMKMIAAWMDRVISNPADDNADKVRAEVHALCAKFPAPGISA
jgi:glycine hydroxymethyltransferase